jgi:hypothetical protein
MIRNGVYEILAYALSRVNRNSGSAYFLVADNDFAAKSASGNLEQKEKRIEQCGPARELEVTI